MAFGYLAALHIAGKCLRCRSIWTKHWAPISTRRSSPGPVAISSSTTSGSARPGPDGPARVALSRRRHPAGAADVRQCRAELPHDGATVGEVPRHRHRAEQGAARQRGGVGARADPTLGNRRSGDAVHRHLGQGQGRGDLVSTTVTTPDGTLLWTQRRSIFARGEGGFGGERGPSTSAAPPDRAPTWNSTSRPCLSRRCYTGCAVTATRCIPIPNS